MRSVVLGVVLAGCFAKPDSPRAVDAGTVVVVDCRGVAFPTVPVQTYVIPGFAGDPAMTSDLLELFFTIDNGVGVPNRYDLKQGRRTDVHSPFAIDPIPLPFNSPTTNDTDPALSADGLTLFFASLRDGPSRLFYTQRETRLGPWTAAAPVQGLSFGASFALAHDGQALYLYQSGRLLRASRLPASVPTFQLEPGDVGPSGEFPSVSGDGLELYYSGSNTVDRAVRATVQDPFPVGAAAIPNAYDGYVVHGNEVLLARESGASNLVVYERSCPQVAP